MIQRPLKTTQTRSAILSTWPGYRVSWQWHAESLGREGDCDAFHEPKQEFSVSQNGDILCAHTNLGTQPCISAAWALRSPTTQLRVLFLPGSLPSSCYCFPPCLQNASWPQSSKLMTWSYFPVQKSPKCLSITCVFATQLASPFQHWPQPPHTTYSGPHNIKLFLGFLTKI